MRVAGHRQAHPTHVCQREQQASCLFRAPETGSQRQRAPAVRDTVAFPKPLQVSQLEAGILLLTLLVALALGTYCMGILDTPTRFEQVRSWPCCPCIPALFSCHVGIAAAPLHALTAQPVYCTAACLGQMKTCIAASPALLYCFLSRA